MPRLQRDALRVNFNLEPKGKEYNQRLLIRAQAIFGTLLSLLPSNYASEIEGPNYTIEMKAVALELAKLELALEDIADDRGFGTTRSDFLYSTVGYLLFTNGKLPPTVFDDEAFRQFLLALVKIYFQGSLPISVEEIVKLFLTGDVTVTENFLNVRKGAAGYDISDQFGFEVNVTGEQFPENTFQVDESIRILLDIVRPAHTLFRIRYIFTDSHLPSETVGKLVDASRWSLHAYYYDDLRAYWGGVKNVDRLGTKTNLLIENEDHTLD
jgi:hypothetical protein